MSKVVYCGYVEEIGIYSCEKKDVEKFINEERGGEENEDIVGRVEFNEEDSDEDIKRKVESVSGWDFDSKEDVELGMNEKYLEDLKKVLNRVREGEVIRVYEGMGNLDILGEDVRDFLK